MTTTRTPTADQGISPAVASNGADEINRTMPDDVRSLLERVYTYVTDQASGEKSKICPAEIAGSIGDILYGTDPV